MNANSLLLRLSSGVDSTFLFLHEEFVTAYDSLDLPGRDVLPIALLVQHLELYLSQLHVLYTKSNNACFLFRSDQPSSELPGSGGISLKAGDPLTIKACEPLSEGLSGNTKVCCSGRDIFRACGVVEN